MKGQMPEGNSKAHECNLISSISTISSAGCLRIQSSVEGEPVNFLLDTGAPVTLLRKDVWDKINARLQRDLEPWTGQSLVGVNGSPIHVHGQANVTIKLDEEELPLNVIVVSSLTTEAIIGLNFLKEMEASVDIAKKLLYFGKKGCKFSLIESVLDSPGMPVVHAMETVKIPSESTQKTLRDAQLEDPIIKPLLISKEAGEKPLKADEREFGSAARRLVQLWDQLIVRDGILYRQYAHPTKEKSHLQLIIPTSLRDEVLEDLHEGALGDHLGMEKMLACVKERFYWPGHHKDTQNWCRNCATCSARKNPPQKPRAPLQSIRTGYPLQMVATDILGPFPESKTGNKYILVVADYFTRWTEAYPIPNQEATTIARKLTDEFFFRFSIPEQLHSDQGRQFESEVIAETCRLLKVAKTRTTPYHPQSDGLVERFNRTLLSMLSTAAAGQPFAWEDHLRRLCMAYNTSVHPTMGYTPFALMFGRQARMPIDIMYGTPAETTDPQFHSEYATQLQQQLQTAYEFVREKTGQKLERQKEFYDRKVHGKPFSVGDLVWLNSPAIPRGQSRKLYSPWTGPYKVVTVISEVTYRIENVQARRQRMVVHFDRLKACPPDMRLPTRQKTKQRKNDQEKDPLPLPPPPGTHLTVSDDVSSVPHAPSNSPPPHRYPQRNRAPPDFFMPGISH